MAGAGKPLILIFGCLGGLVLGVLRAVFLAVVRGAIPAVLPWIGGRRRMAVCESLWACGMSCEGPAGRSSAAVDGAFFGRAKVCAVGVTAVSFATQRRLRGRCRNPPIATGVTQAKMQLPI